jgi:ribosomal protein L21E
MSDGSGEIIIRGGSVEIEFSEQTFQGQDGKYSNSHNKITSVEVTDDNTQQTQTVNIPANGKCTIKIYSR